MSDELGLPAAPAARPSGGGRLVLAGAATIVGAGLIALADLPGLMAGRGYATITLGLGLALLGVGMARLGIDGSGALGSTLGRRGAKTLAAGLVLDGAILGLLGTGAMVGPAVAVVILPLIVAGWTTVIGLGLTVLSMLLSKGSDRRLGWLFVAAILALVAGDALPNSMSLGETNRWIGLSFGALAACGFLAAFAGIGVLAIRRDRADGALRRRAERT